MTIDDQISALQRRTDRIVPETHLRQKLERSAKTGKPLRIKLGMDPTAPDVTLGHCVPLKVVRQFQDWGHKAVLIIGDYTARVGDPSGRNTTRPILSGEEIDANAKTYVAQVGKILLTDPDHLEVRYNGEWFKSMDLLNILKLSARKTVAQMLAREDFSNRYKEGVDIRIHEFLYPLMQGHDSVMVDADVEMGGSDQLFNNLVGRDLMEQAGKEGQCVVVTPLLVGTDGINKMSKSKKNYIAVTDPPASMFQKIMKVKAELVESYFQLVTDVPETEYRAAIRDSAMEAKLILARTIVTWLHGQEPAVEAEAENRRTQSGELPSDLRTVPIQPGAHWLPSVLREFGLVKSSSDARRMIEGRAVKVNGEIQTDFRLQLVVDDPEGKIQVADQPVLKVSTPFTIQVGKTAGVKVVGASNNGG